MITIERVALLRTVDFFAGVPGHVLGALARHADELSLATGDVLLREGEMGDRLFVVADGAFDVSVAGRHVGTLGPGSVVGELAALVPEPRSATVVATATSRVLSIDRAAIDELLLDHPEMARGVITTLVRRLTTRNREMSARTLP